MKSIKYSLFLSLAVLIVMAGSTAAQSGPPVNQGEQIRPRGNQHRQLFRQLGLTPAQLRQIGQLNQRRRPIMEGAQLRFREANRRLDEAIYSDQLDEVEVQERIKVVQMSQGDLIRIRSMNELSIRKILTPEQLIKFRRMRQRFDESNTRGGGQRSGGPESPGAVFAEDK